MFNLLPDRTVMHNVTLGKEPHSRGGWLDLDAMRAETQRVLARLNAAYLSPDRPRRDAQGQREADRRDRQSALNDSKLLIMDEPTSALNQTEVEALFGIVDLLKGQGVTILYVSHRLEEIFRLADTVTVLRDGGHISTSNQRGHPRIAHRGHDRAQAGGRFPGEGAAPGRRSPARRTPDRARLAR
ncbi:MAG: hypothetical protein U0703_04610 [Anaerolineae bacterium]